MSPDLAAVLAQQQTENPVVPPFSAADYAAMPDEQALAAHNAREEVIRNMAEYPLECCWVPTDWWLFLHELCKKRVQHPGAVLELYVSGGIRAGKSYICSMLLASHLVYARRANVFALSRTDKTSQQLQQKPTEHMLPDEFLGGAEGKIKQTKDQRLKFSGGRFTDNTLTRYMQVRDETGSTYQGGGTLEFRFFSQEVESYRGYDLSFVWSDEAVPINHVEAIYDRIVSRAVETTRPDHRHRMAVLELALGRLASGDPTAPRPHPAQLGALLHGVHLISYTPEEGYTPTVRRYLDGAHKPDAYMVVVPELVGKPGVKDPRAPRIAYPPNDTRLVGYLHTCQNKYVDSYSELCRQAKAEWTEQQIRIKLCGDAQAAEDKLYASFSDSHITDWAIIPRAGTLYEVIDPGGTKPWVICWFLCDVAGRVWHLQEWPCPGWPVDGYDLGPWAIPSKGDKLNGDPGPAQKTRLAWSRAHYTRQCWAGRRRIYERMAATGQPWQGATVKGTLTWQQGWEEAGPFVLPYRSLMDSRFAAAPTESKGQHTTVLEAMYEEEHAIDFEPTSGVSLEEGDTMINAALNTQIMGLPGLLINSECQNTLFMFRTYSLPPYRETTSAKDEACKDFRDPIAYCLLAGPAYMEERSAVSSGGYTG